MRRYAAFRLAYRIETDLRDKLFSHLQRLHFAFHDEAQTGQLMARANTDIQQINQVLADRPAHRGEHLHPHRRHRGHGLEERGRSRCSRSARCRSCNIAATRFSHRIGPISFDLQRKLGDLSGVVEESIAGVRAVKGFGAERLQAQRLEAEADAVLERALSAAKLRASFLPLVDFLPALALVVILWYGGHLVLDGNLQIGDLVAFNSYILMLIWPMRMAGMLVAQASRSSAAAGRIHEILSTDTAIDDPRARRRPPGRRRRRAAVRGSGLRVRQRRRRCSTASTSCCTPARPSRSSVRPRAARRPSRGSCPASTTSTRAGC